MSRDVIEDLALLAHPEPRPGEVDPPEAVEEAREQIGLQRDEHAQNLRTMCHTHGEDPLLRELRGAAIRRHGGQAHVRTLLAYGRRFTGTRPDYTWHALAEAAGLPYSTARRAVDEHDVAAVQAALEPDVAPRPQPKGLHPPVSEDAHTTVLTSFSQPEAALVVDALREAAEARNDSSSRDLHRLATGVEIARQTPTEADQHHDRASTWHPANQLSRLFSHALRQAVRANGPHPVVTEAIQTTAALAVTDSSHHGKQALLEYASAALDTAATTEPSDRPRS